MQGSPRTRDYGYAMKDRALDNSIHRCFSSRLYHELARARHLSKKSGAAGGGPAWKSTACYSPIFFPQMMEPKPRQMYRTPPATARRPPTPIIDRNMSMEGSKVKEKGAPEKVMS